MAADPGARPHGPRRRLPEKCVRDHVALLAEPGLHPHRSVYAHPYRRGQSGAEARRSGLFPAVPPAERIPHRLLRQMAHGQSGRHAPARIRPLGGIPRTGDLLQHGAQHQRRARKVRSGTLLHRHTDRPRHRLRTRQRRGSVLHLPLLQIGTLRIPAFTLPQRDVQGRKSGLSAVVQRAGVRNPPTARQGCGRQAARRTGLVRREPAPRLGKEPAGKLARRR